MYLKSLTYSEYLNTPRGWQISDLTLGPINLLVGKNATGKSRSLNVTVGLGNILSGRQKAPLSSGTWDVVFLDDGETIHYSVSMQDGKVLEERFRRGGRDLLVRGRDGAGSLFHEKENKDLDFQAPVTELAAVSRVDKIQHKFLEPLREWGEGVRHFQFGDAMGKTVLAFLVNDAPPPDPRDANAVIALFRKGMLNHPDTFQASVIRDMNRIGYDVENVDVMPPMDITIQSLVPTNPVILFVKERDLACVTQQTEMSKGMWSALAVLIHLNYAVIASHASCIVIDDIGEGLDFERSCRLIDIIREYAHQATVQLMLSTNDRFIMNEVPLEEWSVLQRKGSHVSVKNHENSRALFEEFKFTGLSNFSFFETDFVNNPQLLEETTQK